MRNRLLGWGLFFATVIGIPMALWASQGSMVLPTTGTVTGLNMTTDTNAALAALGSCSSGATAPTNNVGGVAVAGQCWYDTSGTQPVLRIYDGTSWVNQNVVDATNHVTTPPYGPLATTSGSNTYTISTGYAPTALVDGQALCFRIGTTNTAATTLSPNSLTAHPLRPSPGTDFSSGQLVAGSVYCANYRLASTEWITQGYYITSASNPIPSGSEFTYAGFTAPSGFFFENGQAVNRTTFASLMAAITIQITGTTVSTSPTVTGLSSTTDLSPGWKVEGAGIPVGATIKSVDTSTQITLSANASASGTVPLTFFPYGNGDGATTFNVPDARGRAAVGQDNMGGSAANVGQVTTTLSATSGSTAATVTSATGLAIGMFINSTNTASGTTIAAISGTSVTLSQNATASTAVSARFSSILDAQGVGQTGGSLTHVQDVTELATHNHTLTDPGHTHGYTFTDNGSTLGKTSGGSNVLQNVNKNPHTASDTATTGITLANAGSSNPMVIQQPSRIVKYIIKQ